MDNNENTQSSVPAAADNAKQRKKYTSKDYVLAFFIKSAVTALVLWVLLTFVAGVHICHTNNAYPTIRDGEFCLTYRLASPKRGEMIVYKRDGEVRFGRIAAFGGETVDIRDDCVFVDDIVLSEKVVYPTTAEDSAVKCPYKVPDNCVFVLNDFRSDISDSRTYGGIPADDVEGVVVFTMRMRGI